MILKYNPSLLELHDIILEDIKGKYLNNEERRDGYNDEQIVLRKDATLTLEIPTNTSKQDYMIRGTLLQNKINVRKNYDYVFDNLDDWDVTNLTIVNRFGRIQWPGTINIKGVDF